MSNKTENVFQEELERKSNYIDWEWAPSTVISLNVSLHPAFPPDIYMHCLFILHVSLLFPGEGTRVDVPREAAKGLWPMNGESEFCFRGDGLHICCESIL